MPYPNLKAEIDWHSYSSHTIARHAGVTERLLYAAADGNETLTSTELHKIARLLECKFNYLSAPVAGEIKPGKKALRRRRILEEAIKKVADINPGLMSKANSFWKAHWTIKALRAHKTVEYAAYRAALGELQWALKMELYKKWYPTRDIK